VESILKNGLDRESVEEELPLTHTPSSHKNVRGGDYYY
jgi:hypothetical protein